MKINLCKIHFKLIGVCFLMGSLNVLAREDIFIGEPAEAKILAIPSIPERKNNTEKKQNETQPLKSKASKVSVPNPPNTKKLANLGEVLEKSDKTSSEKSDSNLPEEFFKKVNSNDSKLSSSIILPTQKFKKEFSQIKSGDILRAEITHSIIAFPDEKTPVIAQVLGFQNSQNQNLSKVKLLGWSRLEKNSRRIFIDFEKLSTPQSSFTFKAMGLHEMKPGFEGEYHSREMEDFSGQFLSSFVAAYFEGLVPKKTNVFGQVQEDTSLDSAFKKGLSSGAMSTADLFKERLKKIPEFSELLGPLEIQILVLETPIQ